MTSRYYAQNRGLHEHNQAVAGSPGGPPPLHRTTSFGTLNLHGGKARDGVTPMRDVTVWDLLLEEETELATTAARATEAAQAAPPMAAAVPAAGAEPARESRL